MDRLYRETFGDAPVARAPLAQDGSRRRMLRLTGPDGRTAIGVIGPDHAENRAFLSFSKAFRTIGLPVPEVFAADEPAGIYLVEDLGDTTLFDALSSAREHGNGAFLADVQPVYERILSWLPRFQVEGGRAVDYAVAYPRSAYDAQAMLWDCNYFKYDYLKLAHVPFHEARLEEDFRRLTAWLTEAPAEHFVYRDLQSRNIMLRDGEPWFIDYQGGLRGPLQYDVAKLLYEGKAALPEATRKHLLAHYLAEADRIVQIDRDAFLAHFRGFVVLRILQGLGAYGYLGLYGRKPQFLARIPHAIREIEYLLDDDFVPIGLPELRRVFTWLVEHEPRHAPAPAAKGGLTVRVGSFSYKRGVPEDPGGHGGGFVFDCRALPNPGRLAEFAGSSGLDEAVATWLAGHQEVGRFLEGALDMVAEQVEAYRTRGFDSLQVLFGCTGGQHRSVYAAEALAAALRGRSPEVAVPVTHHETAHWPSSARRAPARNGH